MSTIEIIAAIGAPVLLIITVAALHKFDKHIQEQTDERQDDE